MGKKYTCPCCGYMVLYNPDGYFDICPICFWETDWVQTQEPDLSSCADGVSLRQSQKNFKKYGVSELRCKDKVRKPTKDDKSDPNWKPL